MTEAERVARADRAKRAFDEFMAPMFAEIEAEYAERLMEVANTELNRDRRTDKITALSNALKIARTLHAGMNEIIRDGELAKADRVRAQKIEQMTAPQRRLLNIGMVR